MCGIAGYYLRNVEDAGKIRHDALLDALLSGIEHRGRDATGYVAVGENGTLEWQKAAVDAWRFRRDRRAVPAGTTAVLCHVRFATQGHEGFPENNHPVKRGPFYVVHNGHVRNDDELFASAERERFGDVDTEAIVARLASFGNLDAVGDVMAEIEGGAACGFLDERNPRRLTLARGADSPLWVLQTRRLVVFASTKIACEKAHKDAVGSLGKSKATEVREGVVIQYNDGKRTSVGEFNVRRYVRPTRTTGTDGGGGWSFLGDAEDGNAVGGTCTVPIPSARIGMRYDILSGTWVPLNGDACTIPDDGRPEAVESFLRLVERDATAPRVDGIVTPLRARADVGGTRWCEMCQRTEGDGTPIEEYDEWGVTWKLCPDCITWAHDNA